jgi:hypothetical protein
MDDGGGSGETHLAMCQHALEDAPTVTDDLFVGCGGEHEGAELGERVGVARSIGRYLDERGEDNLPSGRRRLNKLE